MTTSKILAMSGTVRTPSVDNPFVGLNTLVTLVYVPTGEICIVDRVGKPIKQSHGEHAHLMNLGGVLYSAWVPTVCLEPVPWLRKRKIGTK